MERKTVVSKQLKTAMPKTPPLHEEPLRGIDPTKLVCEICGRNFINKSQLNRHMLTEHESPEGRE